MPKYHNTKLAGNCLDGRHSHKPLVLREWWYKAREKDESVDRAMCVHCSCPCHDLSKFQPVLHALGLDAEGNEWSETDG